MSIYNSHLKLFILYSVCILFVMLNSSYFEEAANGQPDEVSFPVMSKLILGDSVKYYKLNTEIFDAIIDGVKEGTVMLGAIFSLIGISAVMNLLHLLPIPIYYSWAIFSILLLDLTLSICRKRGLQGQVYESVLMLIPLSLYLIAPNKEFFSTLLLIYLLSTTRTKSIVIAGLALGIIRESLLLIALIYYVAIQIKSRRNFYWFMWGLTILLSLIIPDSYYTDIDLPDRQQSGDLTELANVFINTHLFAFVGIVMKVGIGIFGPIALLPVRLAEFELLAVFYGLTSISILYASYKIRNIIKLCKKDPARYATQETAFRLALVFLTIMSLAPGNPARFIMPVLFPLIWIHLSFNKQHLSFKMKYKSRLSYTKIHSQTPAQ